MLFRSGILQLTNSIKLQKGLLESTIPTPHMLPKFHYSTIPHIINKEFRKVQPANSNVSPQTDPIRTCHLLRTTTTSNVPIFSSITLLHKASVSKPYLHNHLPNKAELKLPNHLIPNPPTCKGLQTLAQLTK